MPRPKKDTTNATPIERYAATLDAAVAAFKRTPSLSRWSEVEAAANTYRAQYLTDLDAPAAPAASKKAA